MPSSSDAQKTKGLANRFYQLALDITKLIPHPKHQPPPTPNLVKYRQLPLLTVILSLLVLSIIGVLIYQNLQLKNYDKKYQECIKNGGNWAESYPPQCIYPISSPDPTTNQSPDSDLTDWKTYTNKKLGFEIKYPQYIISPSEMDYGNIITFYHKFPNNSVITLVISKTSSNINTDIEKIKTNPSSEFGKITTTPQPIKINQINGYSFETKKGSVNYTYRYLQKDNSTYYDISGGIHYVSEETLSPITDQILSTFQFLN